PIRWKKLWSADYSFPHVTLVGSVAHSRGNSCPVAILPPDIRACAGVRMDTACDSPQDRPVSAGTGSDAAGARCFGEPGGGVECFKEAGRSGRVRSIVGAISSRPGAAGNFRGPHFVGLLLPEI